MGSAIGIAIVVGVAVAVQVTVVGRVSSEVHPLVVSLGLQISGAAIGAVWILHRQALPELGKIALAWWLLPLGALGWGIVAALGFSAARLGTTTTLVVVVAAQLVAGLGIEIGTGDVEVGARQPVGVLLLIAAVLLIAGEQ